MKVTVDQKLKTLTVVVDLQEPTLSKAGKTLVVATTHGNVPTTAQVNGKVVIIGLNAYIHK